VRSRLLLILGTGLAVALAGCSSGGAPLPVPSGAGANDINPRPAEALRDGGDLRWPIDALPDNYNYNHFDGTQGVTTEIMGALMPYPFTATADGGLTPNPDYLTSAELTSSAPQVTTYTINPKATWSDGTPITWRDFEAQWKATNGTDPAFRIASKTGTEDIASVVRGVDDRQVVVTYARPFAEWKNQFSPLYPASTNADPATFNTGWLNRIPTTAGPFRLDSIDLTAKTLTVRRDPAWWGRPARLDRIMFRAFERAARADALANNEIDFYKIGSSVDLLKRAQGTPGVAIRQSPERFYNHITFNGAPGAILSDVRLRQAIAKGIDRGAVARRLIGQIVPTATQLGNHVYPYGSKDYRDNSGLLRFDPSAANRELDALGWVRQGPVRVKDGKELRLRLVEASPNPIGEQIDRTVLEQLAQIGVAVVIETVPVARASGQYKTGNFDLVGFAWSTTPTPFSSSRSLYAEPTGNDVQQNYGRIYSPEITALFDQGLRELDDTKRAELGNRIDELIWREVHHLPFYPDTGAYAVRSTLANFGAHGFADTDYVNAGYVK
jgi:peptide/nickel transport system substrate-binding protein